MIPKNPKTENPVKKHRIYLRYFRSVFETVLFLLFVFSIFIYTFQSVTNPPAGIRLEFVTLSISLAGFSLVSASFLTHENIKNQLFKSSTHFVYAAAGFIFFYMMLILETLTKQLALHDTFYVAVGISCFLGAFQFGSGVLRMLRAISMSEMGLRRRD